MKKNVVWTPFYRTATYTDISCPPNTDANYTPFKLYVFKNVVYYWMRKKLGDNLDVNYIERPKNKKLYLSIEFRSNGNPVDLTESLSWYIRNKIEEYGLDKLDWIPVFYFDEIVHTEDGTRIPQKWVNEIINYVGVDESYQPYIDEIGLMINISLFPDYNQLHVTLTKNIRDKLIEYYHLGCVYKPSEKIIENWNLVPVSSSNDNLYRANWKDLRIIQSFGSMTDFLLSRLYGEKKLYLKINNDFGTRYSLSELLYKNNFTIDDFVFTEDGIEITVPGYTQSLLIVNLIDELRLYVPKNEEISFIALKDLSDGNDLFGGILYRVNDQERPYVHLSKI